MSSSPPLPCEGSKVILASASARRRELLARIVDDFAVIPSGIDEHLEPGPFTATIPRLAEAKARVVAASHPAAVILAADTMVVIDGEALGKPRDIDDAMAMLRQLRGRTHEVVTGVAVLTAQGRAATETAVSRVIMARYLETLIERYAGSGTTLDKAGGYAIQDLDGTLVDAVVGSYSNVVGLPLDVTARLLTIAGVRLSGRPSP